MKTFHLDFNTALLRPEVVADWLRDLASLGFDTLLWEVENAFHWRSCPECAVADTLPMDELRKLLALARELGFENIPLFQTLGHCEYVLTHDRYAHLRENGCIDQYCPSNPDVLPFLEPWIDEYLEVFDSPRLFHVGADETMQLGVCPQCKEYVAAHGVAQLYSNHMERVIEMVSKKGTRPMLWADMFLSHPEGLPGLNRDILLCDWAYERNDHSTQVYLFDHGKFPVERAPASAIEAFGDRLFRPDSNRTELNPWVAADHLAAQGFSLMLCPASSHAGDAVFGPRTMLHLHNIGDTVRYAAKLNAEGTILTSWTWHIFPWELQRHLIASYIDAANGHNTDLNTFLDTYGKDRLGLTQSSFARICQLLETPCPLTDVNQLGYFKGCINRRPGGLSSFLADCQKNGSLPAMIDQANAAVEAYGEAQSLLASQANQAGSAPDELAAWKLAADCFAARARSARYLLTKQAGMDSTANPTETAQTLAAAESALRARNLDAILRNVLPHRAKEMVSCQFDDVIQALNQ